jgi:hypothetical protein
MQHFPPKSLRRNKPGNPKLSGATAEKNKGRTPLLMNTSAPFGSPLCPLACCASCLDQNKSGEMRPSASMMDLFRLAAMAVKRAILI